MFRSCAYLAILALSVGSVPARPGDALATEPPPAASAESQSAPDQLTVEGRHVGHQVESRDGESCTVCGKPISKTDVTYLVDGHRVPTHKEKCMGALAAKPAEWLSKLKPRGAFLDASAAQPGLSPAWLILGLYVLAGLIFSALAAHRAFSAGRDPMLWLVIGFLTNIVGFAALLALPRQQIDAPAGVPAGLGKVAATYSPEACPSCGAENHPSARQCSGCGAALTPRIVSEVQRAGLAGAKP